VFCWNVRGLNSDNRQREVRSKIEESECDVICLQETKCESFDWTLIRNFFPKRFDNFAFSPSMGASGGIIVIWNSSVFTGIWYNLSSMGCKLNSLLCIIVSLGI
jgi:exonuclease III